MSLIPLLGPIRLGRCLEALGSAQAIAVASVPALAAAAQVDFVDAQAIRRGIDAVADGRALAREQARMAEAGVRLIAHDEPSYPRLLRFIPDPPPLLYVQGELRDEDALALAVVGTRRCTPYGRRQTQRLVQAAARHDLTIVSGGAYGIDAAAHRAALDARGRTLAVLGSGLGCPYPAEHAPLFNAIAAARGAVVSEWPMTRPPQRDQFPQRNRLISGLALGVLVVEAGERSGALITARLAVEDHNRPVMAVPGPADSPTSAGCHRLLREGWASLVTDVDDLLNALEGVGELLRAIGQDLS